MRFFRWIFRILQPISPRTAAWLAERLFFTARRTRLSPQARALLVTGRRFTVEVEGRHVAGWRWGADGAEQPFVVLVHGWGSRGARLAAFVEPLRSAGFGVVTYDALGQGESARGMTSMPEFARSLMAVVAREGRGAAPHAIIAHSMGCAGTTLALSWGLSAGRLVFLAPAADPPAWVRPFARQLGLRDDVLELVRARSQRRLRVRWSDLNVCDLARALPARPPLLIVHDEADDTVRWQDGSAIAEAWAGSRLVTTQGLGHRGVTSDASVLRAALGFVTGNQPLEHERLEHELFHRDERSFLGFMPVVDETSPTRTARGPTTPGR
jgi:predicted alpha/beta hydrolase family esterase